jgi:hypothetical protein
MAEGDSDVIAMALAIVQPAGQRDRWAMKLSAAYPFAASRRTTT